MDNVMDNVIKVTGDMEADMRVLLSHYLTPSDVDYYMNNEINNNEYGQSGEKRTTTEPLRSEDTVTTI